MQIFLKELTFPSTKHTYIEDITDKINQAVSDANVKQGLVVVNTKHTTLGLLLNEIAEPNLLEDLLTHTLKHIPEDRRSSRIHENYPHPTSDYLHRCQDNPYCDEIDEDYNAASHIRALTFSHPSLVVPVEHGKLVLGKYQQVALFEFDGRDGKNKNPIRERTVQIWIYPAEDIIKLP